MLCAQCHTSNSVDYNFCRECGVRLAGDAPADPQTEQLIARAFALLDQGQFQDAREAAMAALALDAEGVSAHSIMGLAYEREGKIPEAIREYETVLLRNPQSTADRLKLQALRGDAPVLYSQRRLSTQQIVMASAAAAAMLVFGGGYVVMSQLSKPQPSAGQSSAGGSTTGTLKASSASAAGVGSPQAIRPLLPLPAPPTPLGAGQSASAPSPARTPPTPVRPGAGGSRFSSALRPSSPIGPLTLPGAGDRTASASAAGLAPAGIGEVVPIPNAPATAPGGPAIAPVFPVAAAPAAGAPPPAPAPPAPRVGASAAPHDGDTPNEKPKRELMEPETGFIRIEPISNANDTRAAVGAPKGSPPTISLNFAATEAEGATLGDAQRAQRSGQSVRQSNPAEAERHFRQAIGLFEILVRRGGSAGRQAREGLDECRKALAALR